MNQTYYIKYIIHYVRLQSFSVQVKLCHFDWKSVRNIRSTLVVLFFKMLICFNWMINRYHSSLCLQIRLNCTAFRFRVNQRSRCDSDSHIILSSVKQACNEWHHSTVRWAIKVTTSGRERYCRLRHDEEGNIVHKGVETTCEIQRDEWEEDQSLLGPC